MEIYLEIAIGECHQFIPRGKEEEETASIVIAPIKIHLDDENGVMMVSNGCNLWQSCRNANCWYSVASRDASKEREKSSQKA